MRGTLFLMRTESPTLDATDRAIINAMQGDFPLDDQPYLAVANRLGLSETEILTRLQGMLDRRVLTRFGPMSMHLPRLPTTTGANMQ